MFKLFFGLFSFFFSLFFFFYFVVPTSSSFFFFLPLSPNLLHTYKLKLKFNKTEAIFSFFFSSSSRNISLLIS